MGWTIFGIMLKSWSLADRLVVIVGSDFSRTPYYNSGAGKDHWPVGSYMVMEKNAPYTNRVIGATDEEQNALGLDTRTFSTSSFSGTKLVPAHVFKKHCATILGWRIPQPHLHSHSLILNQ